MVELPESFEHKPEFDRGTKIVEFKLTQLAQNLAKKILRDKSRINQIIKSLANRVSSHFPSSLSNFSPLFETAVLAHTLEIMKDPEVVLKGKNAMRLLQEKVPENLQREIQRFFGDEIRLVASTKNQSNRLPEGICMGITSAAAALYLSAIEDKTNEVEPKYLLASVLDLLDQDENVTAEAIQELYKDTYLANSNTEEIEIPTLAGEKMHILPFSQPNDQTHTLFEQNGIMAMDFVRFIKEEMGLDKSRSEKKKKSMVLKLIVGFANGKGHAALFINTGKRLYFLDPNYGLFRIPATDDKNLAYFLLHYSQLYESHNLSFFSMYLHSQEAYFAPKKQ